MNRNIFINKFQNKTDKELEYILENQKKYTEQAVNAAIHILNLRNGKLSGLDSVDQEKIEKENKDSALKNIEQQEKKKWNKGHYAGRLLWFGISCVGCAFYFFAPTLFTSQESLIEKSGEIEVVKTLYSEVSSRGHESIKSELILKLENDKRKYKLAKNIEQSRYNKKYELVKNELKKSGKAIIWIKKTDNSDMEPQVFQIATGERNILYDMEDVKSELKFLFPYMLVLGFFGIGFYLNHKYPDNVNRIFGIKPVHNNV